MSAEISYGKASIPLYRAFATPLAGIATIPESPFAGRSNTLFAAQIDIEVFGSNFMPAYTEGDNRSVVATDTMKNFVLREAANYEGATLEGFVAFLGRKLLATYDVMHRIRVTGRELPFYAAAVPSADGFDASTVLYRRSHDDYGTFTLDLDRAGADVQLTAHECGRVDMQLLKVTGSSFRSFARDSYTTLPERADRPLFIRLDIGWKYADVADAVGDDLGRYVPAEQVRDFAQTVFHEFVSESIQHLIYEIGVRLLARFPQLAEVSFAGQNHTPDPMAQSEIEAKRKVYSAAFPAFGLIKLKLDRADVAAG